MQDFRFDNPFVAPDFRNRHVRLCAVPTPVQPPEGVVERIADANVLGEYRRGKDMACADIVICTRTPEGKGAVLLSLRKPTEPVWKQMVDPRRLGGRVSGPSRVHLSSGSEGMRYTRQAPSVARRLPHLRRGQAAVNHADMFCYGRSVRSACCKNDYRQKSCVGAFVHAR